MTRVREKQLAYSELQERMLDERSRRQKVRKILRIVGHFLGREDLTDLVVVDLGCSVGWLVESAAQNGAKAIGVDIDAPGLARARRERDPRCLFLAADGEALPLAAGSVDVVVFNHIYEHVVDPDAVMAEIRRVLSPQGVVYLGMANRLGVIEPHYRLPFLSWLPRGLADRYVHASGRADHYHERFRVLAGLRRMVGGLYAYDYTFSILAHPDVFAAEDVVSGPILRLATRLATRLGHRSRDLARWLIPTYIWVASKSPAPPRGRELAVGPEPVTTALLMRPRDGGTSAG